MIEIITDRRMHVLFTQSCDFGAIPFGGHRNAFAVHVHCAIIHSHFTVYDDSYFGVGGG